MAEAYLRQSALAHLGLAARAVADPGAAGVRLGERAFRGQLNLRGEIGRKRFRDALEGVLGLVPPRKPGTVAAAGGLACLWLAPDEWLVVTPADVGAETLAALREALSRQLAAVTDVSEGRAIIALAGPRAREVLMKGCGLDLHPRVFAPGRCAQSTIAQAQVLLHQTDDKPGYELYVPRSYADYLWAWLEDAALEYGLAVIEG